MVCCGVVNRGAAIYNGKIIRALLDNQIVALDAKTGKEVWRTKSPAPTSTENGYAMTGAPLVVNGVVIAGVAGAEFSHRGFLEGYDAETGKHLWRHYNDPGQGRTGIGHLGRGILSHRRRLELGDRQLRSGARSRLLGHRQSVAVEPRARAGDNLCDQRGHRDQAEDRRARLGLSRRRRPTRSTMTACTRR